MFFCNKKEFEATEFREGSPTSNTRFEFQGDERAWKIELAPPNKRRKREIVYKK